MNAKQRRRIERHNIRMLGHFVKLIDNQIFEWANDDEINKEDILKQLDTMRREFKSTFGEY